MELSERNNLINISSTTVYISCEGYEDSETAQVEYIQTLNKLATPQCHTEYARGGTYNVCLDNPEDYPGNAVTRYRATNDWEDKEATDVGSTIADIDSSHVIGSQNYDSAKVFVRCDSYEDSDVVIATLQS